MPNQEDSNYGNPRSNGVADGVLVGFSGGEFKPRYYLPKTHNSHISEVTDSWDISHAFQINSPMVSQALKYILRAGHKPGASYETDITKAAEALSRELKFLQPQTPYTRPEDDT